MAKADAIASHPQLWGPNFDPERSMEIRKIINAAIEIGKRNGAIVHIEEFASPRDSIAREKQLKNWHRDWKIRLIEEDNPDWSDLSHLL